MTDPILELVADLAPGEADLLATAKRLIEEPPEHLESIGFYGMERKAPRVRSFLGVVTLLVDTGIVDAMEDKYILELIPYWVQEKELFRAEDLPAEAQVAFGWLFATELPDKPSPSWQAEVRNSYATAVGQIEQLIAANGKVLLSLDATAGDTMMFIQVAPQVAERWRDRALVEFDGYRAGFRSPMWDRLWWFLLYSTRGYLGDLNNSDLPPGITARSDAIPFA